MFQFIDRHKFGLLGTVLIHFAIILSANYVQLPEVIPRQELVIELNFETEEIVSPKQEKVPNENQRPAENNSNKAVNESSPKDVKSGDYNEFNKEPSEASKESFEEQLERELKEIEQQVIQEQRDAGYGYSAQEIDEMLNSQKNKELEAVQEQKPRSEAAYKGNTNITYKLSNRFDTKLEVPVYMCQYAGVVVVNIAVNQSGKVISAKVDMESSKTTDPCLFEAALNSAKKTRFNSKNSAPKIQTGIITYTFIEQ